MRCAAAIRAGYTSSRANKSGDANQAGLLQEPLREVQAEQRIARLAPAYNSMHVTRSCTAVAYFLSIGSSVMDRPVGAIFKAPGL